MTAPVVVGPSPSGGGPSASADWDDVLADIGDRVRAERQARGWARIELARRACLGVHTVKRLEAEGAGTLRVFVLACAALGVEVDYLLSGRWVMPLRSPALTDRQVEVLRAVADGRPLSEAAVVLGMPRDGLASRMSEIYRRLGVSHLPRSDRRSAAVRVAMQYRLFDPGNRTS